MLKYWYIIFQYFFHLDWRPNCLFRFVFCDKLFYLRFFDSNRFCDAHRLESFSKFNFGSFRNEANSICAEQNVDFLIAVYSNSFRLTTWKVIVKLILSTTTSRSELPRVINSPFPMPLRFLISFVSLRPSNFLITSSLMGLRSLPESTIVLKEIFWSLKLL